MPDWGNFIVKLGQVWFDTNFCEELVLPGMGVMYESYERAGNLLVQ